MIVDAFIFYNELDMLECRLEYLYNHVDLFVIVESNTTFRGNPKPLNYLKHQERFKKYSDKIVYQPFIFDNDYYKLDFDVKDEEISSRNNAYWTMESLQRNHISSVTKFLSPKDLVLISDVDEIPNKDAISFVKDSFEKGENAIASFQQWLFYYNLKCRHDNIWYGTIAVLAETLKETTPDELRDRRNFLPSIMYAGWHLSYFFDVDNIINKIDNFSHQEFNTPEIKNHSAIEDKIKNNLDLFGRPFDNFTEIDYSILPKDFLDCFSRFKKKEESFPEIISAWTGHKEFAEWLVNYTNPQTIVDLGVDRGFSTFCFANPKKGVVYGIDTFEGDVETGIRKTYDYVTSLKEKYNFDNVNLIQGYFDDVVKTWDKNIDILHIDGWHHYKTVKNDYENWTKFLTENSVTLLHDTESYPNDVGKFFNQIDLPKINFKNSAGLGVVSKNSALIDVISKKYNLPVESKLKVFVHVTDLPGGREITEEQIDLMISSRLIENAEVSFWCTGDSSFSWLIEKTKGLVNAKLYNWGQDVREYERATLIPLKQHCDEKDGMVLYLHQKGLTHTNNLNVKDWRDYMNHFMITRWKDCISMLTQGYDTVGVNWNGDRDQPHYAGNFWWANNSYVRTLPPLLTAKELDYKAQFNNGIYTLDAEVWLGINSPRAATIHRSDVDHYKKSYPSSQYVDTNRISIIVPTMWRFEPFLDFVEQLVELPCIGEVIIVNNDVPRTPQHKVLYHRKVEMYNFENNTFVNPAWNFAVSKSKYDKICILNDDLIVDLKVFNKVHNFMEPEMILGLNGGVAEWGQTSITDGSILIEPRMSQSCFGFGCMFFMFKKDWVNIPEGIDIAFGDTWAFDTMHYRYGKTYLISNTFYYTPFATTVKSVIDPVEGKKIYEKEEQLYNQELDKYLKNN